MSGLEVSPEALRAAATQQRAVAGRIAAAATAVPGGADAHGIGSPDALTAVDGFTTGLGRVFEALSTAVTAAATALELAASHYVAVDQQIGARLVPVSGPHPE